MKKALRLTKIALVNLLILFVLVELGSVAFYYWKTGEVFYARNRSQDRYARGLVPERVFYVLDESMIFRLHPYLGFTQKPGFRPSPSAIFANGDGFVSSYEYPYQRKNANQYLVGIFGGSVAQYLTMDEFERHLLAENLRKLPALKDREIVILNFALGGYKQPQQALALGYFLSLGQELDMVINLDGFNEVYHAALNNKHKVDVQMPAIQIEQPLLDITENDLAPEAARLALSVLDDKERLKSLLDEVTKCRLASSYLLRAMQIKKYATAFERDRVEFSRVVLENSTRSKQEPIFQLQRIAEPLPDEALYRKATAIWANASIAMRDMLFSRGIPYFHFVQPNQYYSKHRFDVEERKIALTEFGESEYADSIRKGYPALLARMDELKNSNVAVFNATNIFDNVDGPLYFDDCCHFNGHGNEVLIQYISQEIKKAVEQNPIKPTPKR